MANYVTNNIKFKTHESCLKFKELLVGTRANSKEGTLDVCFNKLIPIPTELEDSTVGAIEYSKAKLYDFHPNSSRRGTELELETVLLPYYTKAYLNSNSKDEFLKTIIPLVLKDAEVKANLISLNENTTGEMEQYIKEHAESYYLYTKYGYGNWYNARVSLWGTKWDAIDTDFIEDSDFCYFQTAWSMPYGIFEKLAELGIEFNVGYCSEDTGSSCGSFTTKENKLIKVIGEKLNTRAELFAFACLLNYSCIDDYLEGQGGEDYIEELKGGNEDAKDFLNLIESAKGEVEEKMLDKIREYNIQY